MGGIFFIIFCNPANPIERKVAEKDHKEELNCSIKYA